MLYKSNYFNIYKPACWEHYWGGYEVDTSVYCDTVTAVRVGALGLVPLIRQLCSDVHLFICC